MKVPLEMSDPAAGSPFDRYLALQSSRRADWRFLLPSAALGRVVWAGRRDERLLQSVRLFSEELLPLDELSRADAMPRDVVIALDPSKTDVRRAAAVLRPGGYVYLEVSRGLRRRVSTLRSELERLGFTELRIHWHFPSFSPCQAIVPLDDRGAFSYALSRREAARVERFKAWLARRAGPRAVAIGAPARSIVGRLGSADGGVRRGQSSSEQEFSAVVVTPIAETSPNVVELLIPRGQDRPEVVAKRSRLGESGGLEHEAAVLRALRRAWPKATGAVADVIALEERDGGTVLFETALAGHGLEPAELRRRGFATVDRVVDSLTDLAVATASPSSADDEWYARLLRGPVDRLAMTLDLDQGVDDLAKDTLETTLSLRGLDIPLVFEHGDPAHSNVLLLENGNVGFVDWEIAEPRGLPLHDVCFFLAYVAFARARAKTTSERLEAFDKAFLGQDAWANRRIAAYASRLGLPGSALAPLLVACWARHAARLLSRLFAEPGREHLPEGLKIRRESAALTVVRPWVELWRHALGNSHALGSVGEA